MFFLPVSRSIESDSFGAECRINGKCPRNEGGDFYPLDLQFSREIRLVGSFCQQMQKSFSRRALGIMGPFYMSSAIKHASLIADDGQGKTLFGEVSCVKRNRS